MTEAAEKMLQELRNVMAKNLPVDVEEKEEGSALRAFNQSDQRQGQQSRSSQQLTCPVREQCVKRYGKEMLHFGLR